MLSYFSVALPALPTSGERLVGTAASPPEALLCALATACQSPRAPSVEASSQVGASSQAAAGIAPAMTVEASEEELAAPRRRHREDECVSSGSLASWQGGWAMSERIVICMCFKFAMCEPDTYFALRFIMVLSHTCNLVATRTSVGRGVTAQTW